VIGPPVPVELHPLLAHHVVNTLGWPALRPLQKQALGPISSGEHALIVAPTAGGKTEAAALPVLSRMLTEGWQGLSVLYLCPLRALLNNLYPRLEQYCELVGRRAGLWHGDVGDSARQALRNEPPDVLLTTPESIEAMLLSTKTDHGRLFAQLRCIIVDEIHAFAGDDRGWHLLSVAQRVEQLSGHTLQRVGLSATVGNPDELLWWLTRTSTGPRRVVAPTRRTAPTTPEITLDHVGSLENAAIVISRLHRGEKRLVFVDSRARAEELATRLRERDVTTFVSHGSLGREERRAAESAFTEARDCAIVATSTLELGIDVGDLDRVIQIDAPATVAGFLQRLGRTGRRADTTSNLLFLTTDESDLLAAAGLLAAWEDGFVEPLVPPVLPLHLLAQQLLALTLQEGGVGRHTWLDWLGEPCVLGAAVVEHARQVVDHLLEEDWLFEDGGVLGIGPATERRYGKRNYLDLMAVFSDPPTLRVLAGRVELGTIHTSVLTIDAGEGGAPVLLLAGRSWQVIDVDWRRRVVQVVPADRRGRARWLGTGRGTGPEIAAAVQQILAGRDLARVHSSRRAKERLAALRDEFRWVGDGQDTVVVEQPDGRVTWWTFAGSTANVWLSLLVDDLRDRTSQTDPLEIRLAPGVQADQVRDRVAAADLDALRLPDRVIDGAVEQLKFHEALPLSLAREVILRRMAARETVEQTLGRPVRGFQFQRS
jgi:ATP-dependent helicase Lhr and Lhr-like helicase